MDTPVKGWVRLGMVAVAVPQLITGLWAILATRNWYDDFPGVDPRLVSADPPYNAHLATDAGAGFLATGLALVVGAWLAKRSGVYVALVAYLAFAIPHAVFHAANPAPGLTGSEDTVNVIALFSGIVLALVLAVGAGVAAATSDADDPSSTADAPPPMGTHV